MIINGEGNKNFIFFFGYSRIRMKKLVKILIKILSLYQRLKKKLILMLKIQLKKKKAIR